MKTFIYKLKQLHPNAKITTFNTGYVILEYHANDKSHNTKGPAWQKWNPDGVLVYEVYMVDGQYHNTAGPAIQQWDDNGVSFRQEYWINDKWIK